MLSKNFTLKELCKSDTAIRLGIPNHPGNEEIENLLALAQNILQPIRDKFGPFTPQSGFRSLALNRLLKSKDTSQHVKGQAADIEIPGVSNLDLALWISQNLDFDQLILENYEPGDPSSGWVHVSYRGLGNRGQVLTYSQGGYSNGISW